MRLIDIDDISLRKTIAVGGLSAKALWRRIQQQPTIDAVSVEWIPCEERLPSEDGEYLVTWGEGFVSAFYYGKPTNYRHKEVKGKCFYEYNDEYGDAVCNDAIAWMPLPKPYERSDT